MRPGEMIRAAGVMLVIRVRPDSGVTVRGDDIWITAKVDPALVEIVPMGIEKTQQALMAGALDAATIRERAASLRRFDVVRFSNKVYAAHHALQRG